MQNAKQKLYNLSRWYVAMGYLGAVLCLIPILGFALNIIHSSKNGTELEMFMSIFVLAIMIFMSLLFFLAGHRLKNAYYYVFCDGAAKLMCLFFPPIGTILGIKTLLVLKEDETKALFSDKGTDSK